MYTWKFTISLKFYTWSGPLWPRVPVDREFSSEMQKWDLVRTNSCLHCSWSVHLLTKVSKFKNISLALSQSLLLLAFTTIVHTSFSSLWYISFLHLHIYFRWAGACPAIETPINGRAIPVRGSRMSAFRFVGHLFVWIRNRRLFPKKGGKE